jgi:hypothetical protein
MTELVTLNAAREAQQLAILAQRPDASPREQTSPNTISISQTAVQPDAKRATGQTEAGGQGDAHQDHAQRRDRHDSGLTGPSRPRIEIRSFAPEPKDAGKTNVVADVSLPSAPSGDAQVAQPVTISGDAGVSNSLAASPFLNGRTQAEVEVAIAQQAVQTAAFAQTASPEADLRAARMEAAARAVRATATVQAAAPRLGTSPEAQLKKFSDKAEADQGYVSGEQTVQQKYYGKGSETVVGQFASEQPQKYSDKAAAAQNGTRTEDGSGETKYYDKVAQTDTEYTGGEADGEHKSMYERAQDLAAALKEDDPDAPDAVRKKYSDPTAFEAKPKPAVLLDSAGQPVTIQVTA